LQENPKWREWGKATGDIVVCEWEGAVRTMSPVGTRSLSGFSWAKIREVPVMKRIEMEYAKIKYRLILFLLCNGLNIHSCPKLMEIKNYTFRDL
jgi:hypothetical protein